jgi:hypothetical protein
VDDVGNGRLIERERVNVTKCLDDFVIDFGKRVEQREPEISQAHADFVVHRWLGKADFVGLPQRGDFRTDPALASFGLFGSQRQAVKSLQILRDAASFQQDRLPGDFGGMRGEDRSDLDLAKSSERIFGRDSSLFHP